jgi:hypothetical protein
MPSDLLELMKWQGLGEPINQFRKDVLGLQAMDMYFTLGVDSVNSALRTPFNYSWYAQSTIYTDLTPLTEEGLVLYCLKRATSLSKHLFVATSAILWGSTLYQTSR